MKCQLCENKAVLPEPKLCEEHFINYYEKKVSHALQSSNFKDKKVLIGISGGKDSSALTFILNRLSDTFNLKICLLFIDLKTKDCIEYWKNSALMLARQLKLNIDVIDLYEYGKTLKDFENQKRPVCSSCGVIKRYLLNKYAYENGFDYVASGHNLDDTYYFYMNSLYSQQIEELLRLDKISFPDSENKLAGRFRPLIYLTGEENRLYCKINHIDYSSTPCPYSTESQQNKFKKKNKDISRTHKYNFVRSIRKLKRKIPQEKEKKKFDKCTVCGFPTSGREKCMFCTLMERNSE